MEGTRVGDSVDHHIPLKGRRTTWACVHCRRRKTKCDGGQPCYPCQTSANVCSYDTKNGRMTTAIYIKSLEQKVDQLEEKLDRQHMDSGLPNHQCSAPGSMRSHDDSAEWSDKPQHQPSGRCETPAFDEDVIETMVGAREGDQTCTNSLEYYRGRFAGLSLLQRVQNLCRYLSGISRSPGTEEAEDQFVHAFNFLPPSCRPALSLEAFPLLPPPEVMDYAIDVVVNQACTNMQFLDRDNLHSIARQVYAKAETGLRDHRSKALALLYAVLALAKRFEGTSNGLHFFCASRALIDPADCHDLVSLQTLLCIILYAQASSMMSTCYSYVCMAVAASLQIGLFTDTATHDMSSSDKISGRRIFCALNIMDTYVTIALGLPKTLRDVDSDRTLPTPAKPVVATDSLSGTYAHAQLIQILAAAVDSIHPVTRPITQKNGFYGVDYHKIAVIEKQLEAWFAQLPPFPYATDTANNVILVRSQLLLRLSYAHVQMVLYKPFLHHALTDLRQTGNLSLKAYACGSACINAAMQVVWLAERLEASDLFNEAYWFTTLILAFTASCLALFALSNKKDPTLAEISDAVRRIRELCNRYAERNASMQRCSNFLNSLPRQEESTYSVREADTWSKFAQGLSITFDEACQELDSSHSENVSGGGILQALSLPFNVQSPDQSLDITVI